MHEDHSQDQQDTHNVEEHECEAGGDQRQGRGDRQWGVEEERQDDAEEGAAASYFAGASAYATARTTHVPHWEDGVGAGTGNDGATEEERRADEAEDEDQEVAHGHRLDEHFIPVAVSVRHGIDELAEDSRLTRHDLHSMEAVSSAEAASPAPIVLADIARHVRTPSILFDQSSAAGTSADFDSGLLLAPVFEPVHVLALAALPVVRLSASSAHSVLALWAHEESLHLLAREEGATDLFLWGYPEVDNLVTIRSDAKHQVLFVLGHSLVLLELFVFLEGLGADEVLDLLKSRHAGAPMLWALQVIVPILL